MSTPAGWYPVDGGQRYWDGQQWTEHFQPAAAQEAQPAQQPLRAGAAQASHPQAGEPDTLWSAVGKPITQIGAGKYRLTERFLFFERGALRTNAQQIPIEEVHDVDATQTMTQKARGVGSITLSVVRTSGTEVVRLEDISEFREGVRAINEAAHKRREAMQTRANTQTVNYSGSPFGADRSSAHTNTPTTSEDIFALLERLGALREAGVLTEEEFQSKKTELLGRL